MTYKTARAFLTTLFAPYPVDEGLTCEIRCLDGTTANQRWFGLHKLDQAARYARAQREEFDVYTGILPRLGRGGYAKDCLFTAWLWVDIDKGAGTGEECFHLWKKADLPRPAMFVFSGSGGAHVYYPLTELVDLRQKGARERFTAALRRLCKHFGGESQGAHADTASAEIARILRVPATCSHKFDPPRDVMLIKPPKPEPHPLEWWEANLPFEPVPVYKSAHSGFRVQPRSTSERSGLDHWAEQWALTPAPHGGRHKEMASTARFLRTEGGYTDAELMHLLTLKASVSPGPIITAREMESIIKWA